MRKILPIFLFALLLGAVLAMTRRFDLSCSRSQLHERLDAEDIGAQQLWDYLRLRDPATGEIPRGIHTRELAFARTLANTAIAYKGTPAIHTTGWNSAGPVNAGGRTRAIGIDTMDEANILIATAQGGIFRSADSGKSWVRTTAPGQLKNMACLIQDHRPGKTGIWYAGTGELISTTWRRTKAYVTPDFWHSADIGNGMYKSTDDGRSWNVLPATVDATPTTLDSAFDGIWGVAVDNSRHDSDVVYAAGFGAIMRSNNGGASWQHVLGDRTHISYATDVAITSSGILYAFLSGQTADMSVSPTSGMWRSTDGFHWTNISPQPWPSQTGRMRIAIASSNENIFYIGGVNPDLGFSAALYKYTYLSSTGAGTGGRWEDRSLNVPATTTAISAYGVDTYGGYCITLEVHPTDPNIVFFGGTNLYRSFDGFATPDQLDWIGGYDPTNGQYGEPLNDHPDHHALKFVPSNPSVAYDATDGGMYMTYDVLGYDDPNFPVIWNEINFNDRASILYDVAIDHATPGDTTVLGGFQDQGSWLSNDSGYWDPYLGGDGCYCAIDDGMSNLYMSAENGYIAGYNIAQHNWNLLTSQTMAQAQFVAPFLLDPTNTDQMYYADNNLLWRDADVASGGNWDALNNSTLADTSFITALGMSTIPAHRLYYGTSDGHLYRMDNADLTSPTPIEITGSIFPKNAFISCVAVDPQNADSIVVCFSNYGVISIFASNDAGTTWHDASGNLEQNPDGSGDGPSVRWVTIVHQNGETLYLCGTSVGLFSTTDISGPSVTWVPEGAQTIGYAIVENIDARQSDGFVAIATQGSGVYTAHVVASPSGVAPNGAEHFAFTISPNPARSAANIYLTTPGTAGTKMEVLDIMGKTVIPVTQISPGQSEYSLECSRLPSGTYFVQLQSGEAIETRRLVVQR